MTTRVSFPILKSMESTLKAWSVSLPLAFFNRIEKPERKRKPISVSASGLVTLTGTNSAEVIYKDLGEFRLLRYHFSLDLSVIGDGNILFGTPKEASKDFNDFLISGSVLKAGTSQPFNSIAQYKNGGFYSVFLPLTSFNTGTYTFDFMQIDW